MIEIVETNIDAETISSLGLQLSDKHVNAEIALHARVFEYPHLDNVFIMESDLYGNSMPKGSCFLAFKSEHGLVGKHMTIENLLSASVAQIKRIVENNTEG